MRPSGDPDSSGDLVSSLILLGIPDIQDVPTFGPREVQRAQRVDVVGPESPAAEQEEFRGTEQGSGRLPKGSFGPAASSGDP